MNRIIAVGVLFTTLLLLTPQAESHVGFSTKEHYNNQNYSQEEKNIVIKFVLLGLPVKIILRRI